jgi:hypothetical protein
MAAENRTLVTALGQRQQRQGARRAGPAVHHRIRMDGDDLEDLTECGLRPRRRKSYNSLIAAAKKADIEVVTNERYARVPTPR